MIEVLNMPKVALKTVNLKYTGGFRLSKAYLRFTKEMFFYLKKPPKILEPPYKVVIYQKSYLDIDNAIKAILDCLNGVVIKDDRYIIELNVVKISHKRGKMSSLRVFVQGDYSLPEKEYFPVID